MKKLKKKKSFDNNPLTKEDFETYFSNSSYNYQQYNYSYFLTNIGNDGFVDYIKNTTPKKAFLYSKVYTDIGISFADVTDDGYPMKIALVILAIPMAQNQSPVIGGSNESGGSQNYYDYSRFYPDDVKPYDYSYESPGSGYTTPDSTPPTSTTPTYSYSEALSIAQNNCAQYSNSSAYQQCVIAYLRKFGY